MIEIYGKLYAPRGHESRLAGVEINGTYQKERQGVIFLDLTGKERVAIRRDGFGPVSVGKAPDGARWYMYATSSRDEAWMGVPESWMAEKDGAEALARQVYHPRPEDSEERYRRDLIRHPLRGGVPRPAWEDLMGAAQTLWAVR
jgi:hypothetical protein